MKLLLDENISYRILNSLASVFPGSIHVSKEGSVKSDVEVFQYAKRNDFTILTFDEDFYDLQLIKGFPPKIIWLRVVSLFELLFPLYWKLIVHPHRVSNVFFFFVQRKALWYIKCL